MKTEDYESAVRSTSIYGSGMTLALYSGKLNGTRFTGIYPFVGLAEEAGEVVGKLKKAQRDSWSYEEFQEKVSLELGDVLWYVTACANEIGMNLEQIMELNIRKLSSRKARGTLHGEGDNR